MAGSMTACRQMWCWSSECYILQAAGSQLTVTMKEVLVKETSKPALTVTHFLLIVPHPLGAIFFFQITTLFLHLFALFRSIPYPNTQYFNFKSAGSFIILFCLVWQREEGRGRERERHRERYYMGENIRGLFSGMGSFLPPIMVSSLQLRLAK